jgi:hypothetical protein
MFSYLTGIRSGEVIVGIGKQCKGSVLQIKGFYPPSKKGIEELSNADIRDRFGLLSFFKELTQEERKEWLNKYCTDNSDLYLQDVDLKIKVIKFSGDFINSALTEEQISEIIAGNPKDLEGYWPIKELYEKFPKKPGSRARRHTLVFRPGNWAVLEETETVKDFKGILVYVENGEIEKGKVQKGEIFHVVEPPNESFPEKIAIIVPKSSTLPTIEELFDVCETLDLDREILVEIHGLIKWFSPSVHKSLIQKLIRTRASTVSHLDKIFPSGEVLAASFCMLLIHHGAFVPNIQRFVSGLESATKRLAVSINEDSFIESDSGGNYLLTLYASAWLSQNVSWVPSLALITTWISVGLAALDSPLQYDYDVHKPTKRIKEWSPFGVNYFLLAAIKSFENDINMLDTTADRDGRSKKTKTDVGYSRMPLIHSIDHHSYTDIAHYLNPESVMGLKTYANVFKKIWNDVTGLNIRHDTTSLLDKVPILTSFQKEVRRAQLCVWSYHTIIPEKAATIKDELIEMTYSLSQSWLAAMVGPIEYKLDGGITAIVMISPNNILNYSAIKRPSRTTGDNPELSEREKIIAIDKFQQDLIKGINLQHISPSLSQFKGSKIRLDTKTDEYYLLSNGREISWSSAVELNLSFPVHNFSLTEDLMMMSIFTTGDGIHELASEKLEEFIKTMPISALQRAITYISTYKSEIEIFHIGRNGEGVDYSVVVEDTWVNYLLGTIAVLYPAALVKHKQKYNVKCGPLMWTIAKFIRNFVDDYEIVVEDSKWPTPIKEKRLLWEHQTEAIEKLNTTNGLRIIWIPPGLGKTLICCTYIANKISAKTMLKYCLYTLPPSAMETIKKELEILGLPYVHLDMRGNSKKKLVPWKVNIIYHDHLRMADLENIKSCSSELLFINDEFHKTVAAGTQRTSTALEIARLSKETVCMTGTLIRNDETVELIEWLQMAVDFEVTTKNFWVAISSIISRKVQTKTIITRLVQEADMNKDERKNYLMSLPKEMGGSAHTINFKEAVKISYSAVTREIINLTISHLEEGLYVFIVAKNVEHQNEIKHLLEKMGVRSIYLIGKDKAISLTPENIEGPDVVITTPHHAEGYNMTRCHIMITGVYFTNQAVREQLECRINRIGGHSNIKIIIIHAGILTRIHEHYERARSFAAALKGFAKSVKIDIEDLYE